MGTQLKLVVAISQKTYSTAGVAPYSVAGSPIAGDSVARTADEWFQKVVTDAGGFVEGLSITTYREFNLLKPASTVEFLDQTIADMLGFEISNVYAAAANIALKWGTSKLVLQNSVNPSPLSNSIVQSFEEKALDFNKNVTILRGFAPISDYEVEDDREAFMVECRMLPILRRNDVKLFLEANGKNEAEGLYIWGLSFKVPETTLFNLNLEDYSGISENYSNKNLKQFDIGFIVAV